MFPVSGGKAALFCLSLFLLLCPMPGGKRGCALASPHITDFTLGMSAEELASREAGVCDEKFPHILCGEVVFGGKTWQGNFHVKEGALDSITLTAPVAGASLEAAMQGFRESPYVLYAAFSDDLEFDFVKRAAQGESPESMDAAFAAFLGELKTGPREFVAYFYTEPPIYDAAIRAEKEGGRADASGVACCLALGKDGVSVFITSWMDMHAILRKYQDEGKNRRVRKGG